MKESCLPPLSFPLLSTHNSAWNHLQSLFWHQSCLIVHFGAVLWLTAMVTWCSLLYEIRNMHCFLNVTITHWGCVRGHLFISQLYLLTTWLDDWRIRNLQLFNMLSLHQTGYHERVVSQWEESRMQRLPRTKPTCRSAIWCTDSCGSQLHIVRVFRAPKLKCFRERNVPLCVVVWHYMPPQDTLTHTCTYTKWYTETKKGFIF